MTDADRGAREDAGEPPIRVLLVDADPMQREGWRLVIDAQPDMAVVEEAGDGVQALAVLRKVVADVAIIDARLPRLGGVQVTEAVASDARVRLVQSPPVTRVVLVTATDLDRFLPLGLEAGAHAVLYKDTAPDDLLAVVRAAASERRPLRRGSAGGGLPLLATSGPARSRKAASPGE